MKKPKVILLTGPSTNPNAFGSIWHYFEQTLKYPVSIITVNTLDKSDLTQANVLVMPSGNYGELTDYQLGLISDWTSEGGKLIAIGGALRKLESNDGFLLQKVDAVPEEDAEKEEKIYGDRERENISGRIPGAFVKNTVDVTHPLGYGLGETLFSIKTSQRLYALNSNVWNVVKTGEDPMVIGFVGSKLYEDLSDTMTFSVQHKGSGTVVYMVDDPLFRGFWYMGKLVFANALLQVW